LTNNFSANKELISQKKYPMVSQEQNEYFAEKSPGMNIKQ
jgi:hypothetical protein